MMRSPAPAAMLAAAVLLSACGLTGTSPPSSFYVLSAVAPAAQPRAENRQNMTVLVGQVSLPKHLDRTEVVTFANPNRLQLAEFDRWAEPLDENIARVLAENLSRLVPTDGVAIYSEAGPISYDYKVLVAVPRLELSADGRVFVSARWRLHGKDDVQLGPAHRFDHEERAEPRPEMMAAAVSRALARLSAEIAKGLVGSRPSRAASASDRAAGAALKS